VVFLALGLPGTWIRRRWLQNRNCIGGGKRIFQALLERSFKPSEAIGCARREMIDVCLIWLRVSWLLVSRWLGFGWLAARHHGHYTPLGDQRVARQFVHLR
jgi:hypothetical protein